jgi:hypothetical protein
MLVKGFILLIHLGKILFQGLYGPWPVELGAGDE